MHRKDGADEPVADDRCSHCLRPVPSDLGVENSHGSVLCGACYFVLWGPRAKRAGLAAELRRPQTRREEKGKPIWIPGPSGGLDLGVPPPRGTKPVG